MKASDLKGRIRTWEGKAEKLIKGPDRGLYMTEIWLHQSCSSIISSYNTVIVSRTFPGIGAILKVKFFDVSISRKQMTSK
jgi:hypothetical protein